LVNWNRVASVIRRSPPLAAASNIDLIHSSRHNRGSQRPLRWDESLDIGSDTGTPVNDADYKTPFAFTGRIEKITLIDRPAETLARGRETPQGRRRANGRPEVNRGKPTAAPGPGLPALRFALSAFANQPDQRRAHVAAIGRRDPADMDRRKFQQPVIVDASYPELWPAYHMPGKNEPMQRL
jgi:hypothetical protein